MKAALAAAVAAAVAFCSAVATAADAEAGRRKAEVCVACHGPAGRGNGPAAVNPANKPIDISRPYMADIKDGEIFAIISGGWSGMPGFAASLSENARWDLVNYIRTLAAVTASSQ